MFIVSKSTYKYVFVCFQNSTKGTSKSDAVVERQEVRAFLNRAVSSVIVIVIVYLTEITLPTLQIMRYI